MSSPWSSCWTRRRHWSRAPRARRTTRNGPITAVAVGSSSLAAVVDPVNPSIATTSTPSHRALGHCASHALNAALERPRSCRATWPARSQPGQRRRPPPEQDMNQPPDDPAPHHPDDTTRPDQPPDTPGLPDRVRPATPRPPAPTHPDM